MGCIVHGVTKCQTPPSDFHFLSVFKIILFTLSEREDKVNLLVIGNGTKRIYLVWQNFFFNLYSGYLHMCMYIYIYMLLLLSHSVVSNSVWPHRWQPTRLPRPWDSPGKNTGVGCHFLLQCMKVKSESEVAQLCLTLFDPMDCSLPGSSILGIFQARVLEWGAIAFSNIYIHTQYSHTCSCVCKIIAAFKIYIFSSMQIILE